MFLSLLYYTKTFLVRAHWLGMATLMLSFMPDQLQSRKRWVFHIFFLERHYYTVKLFFFLQCVKLLFFLSCYMQKYLKKPIRSMISFLFFRWPKTKLVIKNTKNVMFCTIWYHFYSLKNVKNTHGGALLLVKLQAFSLQLY